MGKVLILGGTKYFGKRLVELLHAEGRHEITVATRGITGAEFDKDVRRITVNRTDADSLGKAAAADSWDIVYDNICFSPNEALIAVDAFEGRVGRYVLTSTLSVYGFGSSPLREEDMNPFNYPWATAERGELEYGEGKRQAEAVFFQKAAFPVAAMRIPIVLGPDDYTRRLHFHVEHVKHELPIVMPNPSAEMSFISSAETAEFLQWLGSSELVGPVNACSEGHISLSRMMEWIEEATGKKANLVTEGDTEHHSPLGIPSSWTMDTSKAAAGGYRFSQAADWLSKLIADIAAGRA